MTRAQSGDWELAVCADPNSLPFSNQSQEGFENRIAQVLAEELGASLSYDWYPQTPDMITYRLRGGHCDVIMGIPDGVGDVLNTVAYYRSPYVFVYREDSGFRIESLDDPVLRELRITVQNIGIPPHDALVDRGLAGNVVSEHLRGEQRVGTERSSAVIDAVVEGEADVALVWGPVAGYLEQQVEADLLVEPITPQFEPPFRTQSFPMTIGVRAGDEALRHRLDVALARRWDEINTILAEYGVPTQEIPQPLVSPRNEALTYVGFVSPTLTGQTAIPESLYELVGDAASKGALLAEGDVGRRAPTSDLELDVLFASTPTAKAARRAAERLVATEEIVALLGGTGAGQAEALAEVAEVGGIPFINTGSALMPRQCRPHVFHVEASAHMYLRALVGWFDQEGSNSWYVVHEEGAPYELLLEPALQTIRAAAGEDAVMGIASVGREQPSYASVIADMESSEADTALLLLHPRDQIAFAGQLQSIGGDARVAPFPDPVTQTREFLAAARRSAGRAGVGDRVLLWEATLKEGPAGELNDRYSSRYGTPMEPSAWAAYQGVTILFEVILAAGDSNLSTLAAYLESAAARFDVAKGSTASFTPARHQLRQSLYVVEIDPQAPWGAALSRRLAVAELRSVVPAEELDGGAVGSGSNLVSCEGERP